MQRAASRPSPRLKEAAKLIASSRERRRSGRCVLEGEHLIGVYLARIGAPEFIVVVEAMLADPRIAALTGRIAPADVVAVPGPVFAAVSTLPEAIGALAVVATPAPLVPPFAQFHLLLDDLQDPGNVGTILRTAAAAGVQQVLLSKHCAFAWSPKVLRAAQGAHFLTTVVEDIELPDWVARFRAQGGQLMATVARDGANLYTTPWSWPLAVAIGNEGAGLSKALLAQADCRASIPMHSGTESLNASAAAAVVLFEAVRRRSAAPT